MTDGWWRLQNNLIFPHPDSVMFSISSWTPGSWLEYHRWSKLSPKSSRRCTSILPRGPSSNLNFSVLWKSGKKVWSPHAFVRTKRMQKQRKKRWWLRWRSSKTATGTAFAKGQWHGEHNGTNEGHNGQFSRKGKSLERYLNIANIQPKRPV